MESISGTHFPALCLPLNSGSELNMYDKTEEKIRNTLRVHHVFEGTELV